MTPLAPACLPDRTIIALRGDDTVPFLQGLVTANIANLAVGDTVHTALLTPQGKVLSAFFVWRTDAGLLLDTLTSDAPMLIQRLKLYKLRAKVEITVADDLAVFIGDAGPDHAPRDPRLAALGQRWLAAPTSGGADAYHARRIGLCVPEFGADYGPSEVFSMDVNLDALGAVDYKKGCFVGQEVASRMHRKGQVRKRSWRIAADRALLVGAAITADASTVGTVTSAIGRSGIALVRADRVDAAAASLKVDDLTVTLSAPDYL